MVFPDLTRPRVTVQRLMAETCAVHRDLPTATLDEVTLELVPEPPDAPIYDGPCLVTPTGDGYSVKLPFDAPEVLTGDVVTVTASDRDPQLTGRVLRVDTVSVTSFLVWRVLGCGVLT